MDIGAQRLQRFTSPAGLAERAGKPSFGVVARESEQAGDLLLKACRRNGNSSDRLVRLVVVQHGHVSLPPPLPA